MYVCFVRRCIYCKSSVKSICNSGNVPHVLTVVRDGAHVRHKSSGTPTKPKYSLAYDRSILQGSSTSRLFSPEYILIALHISLPHRTAPHLVSVEQGHLPRENPGRGESRAVAPHPHAGARPRPQAGPRGALAQGCLPRGEGGDGGDGSGDGDGDGDAGCDGDEIAGFLDGMVVWLSWWFSSPSLPSCLFVFPSLRVFVCSAGGASCSDVICTVYSTSKKFAFSVSRLFHVWLQHGYFVLSCSTLLL